MLSKMAKPHGDKNNMITYVATFTCARREEDTDEEDEGGVDVGGDVAHFRLPAQVVLLFIGRIRNGVSVVAILCRNVVEET